MDVKRFKHADHERNALAFAALGYLVVLRNSEHVPQHVRTEAQRIHDRYNALSREMDAATDSKAVEAEQAAIRG